MRTFLAFLTLCCMGVVLYFSTEQKLSVPELTLGEIREKYSHKNSKFIDIDGVNLHYVDAGEGPAIVFLHASYLNLDSWNGLVKGLGEKYRTIRFDLPGAGLSGLETKALPDGGFDMVERQYELVSLLVDELGVGRLILVGTSSGGTVAYRYAARHPDRVTRLILINSAGLPRTPQTNPLRSNPAFKKWADLDVRPREYWEKSLNRNFTSASSPPDWLIDRAYDFQRRVNLKKNRAATYLFQTGDVQTILSQIKAPTMIMWGKENPTVVHLEADVIEHWMTGAPTILRKYSGLGHYPYIEDINAILPDVKGFLSGELDSELRQTIRAHAFDNSATKLARRPASKDRNK